MEDKDYNNLNYGGGFTEEDIKRVSLFEQAANNWIKSTSEFLSVKNGFKAGAKWQQERMYSEEDVISLLDFVNDRLPDLYSRFNPEEELEEWFEEFKKK
jgi:hypothetical protein